MAISRLGNGFTILAFLGFSACSAAPVSTGVTNHGAGGSGNNGGAGSGANGASYNPGTGGAVSNPDAGRPPRCDADGTNCRCINIATIGAVGWYGSNGTDSSSAFQAWLNNNSVNTVKADAFTARADVQTLLTSPDQLANYDVLIFQFQGDMACSGPNACSIQDYWTYSSQETQGLSNWVNAGGGIVTLTGYYSDNTDEIAPINQLLNFSGLQYNGDDILNASNCSAFNNLCYCWCNSLPINNWPGATIMQNVTEVGANRGRSIDITASAAQYNPVTIATDANGLVVAAGEKVGNGAVFVFSDEWVTYTSQWQTGGCPGPNYDSGYDPCYGKSAPDVFQTAQFWYDAIYYVSPVKSCFKVVGTTPIVN